VSIPASASQLQPVTDSEVLDQFKVAGGKGPIPDIHGVKQLTHAINHGEFVGIFGTQKSRRELAKNAKFTLSARLRKILATARILVLEDAKHYLLVARLPHLIPEIGGLPELRRVEAMLNLASAIVQAETAIRATEWPAQEIPRAEWHDDALRLARHVRGTYEAAGRRHVSFGKQESPAIKVLVWALEKVGHSKSKEAVVQAIRRSRSKV
jgi:hypothetical protein